MKISMMLTYEYLPILAHDLITIIIIELINNKMNLRIIIQPIIIDIQMIKNIMNTDNSTKQRQKIILNISFFQNDLMTC